MKIARYRLKVKPDTVQIHIISWCETIKNKLKGSSRLVLFVLHGSRVRKVPKHTSYKKVPKGIDYMAIIC